MNKKTAAVAVPVIPMAVMLVIGCWGLDRGGIWRDEAATFQVARRTVPQIWRLLHQVDAVHGLYYLLMRPVLAVHPGEVLLRLPSVLAATVTAGLVAALGARLARPRVGLGPVCCTRSTRWSATTPRRAGRTPWSRPARPARRCCSYGRSRAAAPGCRTAVVVAVTCLLHEFAVLLLLAHAVTLALARVPRRVWAGWLFAAGTALLALLPAGAALARPVGTGGVGCGHPARTAWTGSYASSPARRTRSSCPA